MKKIVSLMTILIVGLFVLSGCSQDSPTGNVVIEPKVENNVEVKEEVVEDKQYVAKTSDLKSGDVLEFQIEEEDAILANFNGEFMAYYATCPVHKLKVETGEVEENEFACPHGTYNFDGSAKSGTPLKNNAVLNLIELKIIDGNIYVN